MSPTRLILGLGWLVSILGHADRLTAQKPYEEVKAFYDERVKRPSLWKRTEGRRALAETRDLRALEILVRDYHRPEQPREPVRTLTVALAAEHLAANETADVWAAWRGTHRKPEDAWLWLQALAVEARAGSDAWREVAASRDPAPLRAAAVTAGRASYAGRPDAAVMSLLEELVIDKRQRGAAREIMLEAVLSHFERGAVDTLTDLHRPLLRAIAHQMGNRSTSTRSRIVLARSFARILERDDLGPVPEAWIALLEGEPSVEAEVDYARRRAALQHTFFGIPGHGRHVVYVIDASDSMLTPLTELERGELTGVEQAADSAERAAGSAAQAIDWERVTTRFDAARELLKASIRRLHDDQRFAVVLFGSESAALGATGKLVKPTAKTIDGVIDELDAIRSGPVQPNRPHGTLRGETNLHGGLVRAFELTTKRPLKRHVDVAIESFDDACDTIYLLSDGQPSWDDYNAIDSNDDGLAGDPEAGTSYKYDGELNWYGPFAYGPHLVSDIQRLNMLRRCALHVIGLGEADFGLLGEIAAAGHGELVRIGSK